MPAIQVARTDTFETQRVKINEIGSQVFSITQGGSDLATGNLKLGDGTRTAPSLAFTSDASLGIFKPAADTLGYVSNGKKLLDVSSQEVAFFKDIFVRQNILSSAGLSILNNGQNYDTGTYTDISLTGGTGDGAIASIVVVDYSFVENASGSNYYDGIFSNVSLSGGTGSGAKASFSVDALSGDVVNAGSGYVPGTYQDVPFTGGSGSNSTATVEVTGNVTFSGSITNPGSSYDNATYSSVSLLNVPTQTFVVTTVANPGTPPPDNVYQIDGNTQQVLTLVKGNTYKFDLSDASNSSHPFVLETTGGIFLNPSYYRTINRGPSGTSDASIYLVIKDDAPTETIRYNCASHNGMGANINIIDGTPGNYGTGVVADIEVTNNVVSSVTFTDTGVDYKLSDTLEVSPLDVTGGSGFQYQITGITYDGTVTSVTVTNNGINYLKNDILSISDSDLGGGGGSSFSFVVTSNPGKIDNFTITEYGTGYQVGDLLSLSDGASNISTSLNGVVSGLSSTLDIASKQITLSSTTGLLPGMSITQDFLRNNDIGVLAPNTSIDTVDSPTQITLTEFPTTSGAVTLDFITSLAAEKIVVSSLDGIFTGSIVTKVSGDGVLDPDTTVTNINTSTNEITLSNAATFPGNVILNFASPYGSVDNTFEIEIDVLGPVDSFTITSGGNGYSLLDQLSVNPRDLVQSITYQVKNEQVQLVTLDTPVPTGTFTVGTNIKRRDGNIISISSIVTSTDILSEALANYTNLASTSSSFGSDATFDVTRDASGVPNVILNNGGHSYEVGDTITISGALVGGSSPTDDITFTVENVFQEQGAPIFVVNTSGSNIVSLLVGIGNADFSDSDILINEGDYSSSYSLSTASTSSYRFFIDSGNGYELTPNLTLYVGNTYSFDVSDASNNPHIFSLSKYRDGIWGPSFIQNVQSTLVTTSAQITVSSTSNILEGMLVTVESGSGSLSPNVTVVSIDGPTTLTLSSQPITDGLTFLSFRGVEYTESVTRTSTELTIKITESTPNLYYYCATLSDGHSDEGGTDNQEALITIDQNNPKTFGSGFLLSAVTIDTDDVISGNIETGAFNCVSLSAQDATLESLTVSTDITTDTITSNGITTNTIGSSGNLTIISTTNFSSNVNIGSTITTVASSGNITTSGILKTTNSLNVNDALTITNNNISSTSGNDILLSPATGRVAKVNTNTALIIPAGNSSQRPTSGIVANGAIRFNTDSGQYEGYNASTTSWASLGGVRDLDGNTYIAAEASVGANDNTLYFFNDGNNTVSVTPNYLQFVNVKKIRSINTTAPAYTEYATNTQVTAGDYVKYRNNIYEVTQSGQTGTSGNEPTHTSGAALNGTAELTWSITAVAPITFEETEEVRIDPLGFTDLVVNAELRFSNNVISTDLNDLIVRPNTGKKVTIDTNTSLVVPVGDSNQRGVATQGSIRFNTTTFTYEGYDGTNWGSLGGVKDVDQNTYIIPELSPGSNENILFFYNNGTNTIQLTESSLEFTNIDSITSVNNNLDIEAQTVTFNNLAATIDTSGTSTFIHTTKDNLDLGLAVGLNVDPLLRLDINGDIYVNKAFGTGSFDGLKLINSSFDTLELSDLRIDTQDIQLIKGGTNSGAAVLYDPTVDTGSRVTVSVHNQTTGDKEMIEYHVTDKGSDIFHSDISNLITGVNLVTPVFDFDAGNNVRVTFTLTDLTIGDVVNITVVSNTFKK